MRIILCDRCGGKIAKEEPVGHITVYGEANGYTQGNNDFAGWDFCPDCMAKITSCIKGVKAVPDVIKSFAENMAKQFDAEESIADELEEELDAEPVVEPDIESEDEPINEPIAELAEEPKKDTRGGTRPGSGKKPSIDWPKFKACVDAGRDNKWLAVEFGTDVERIPKWRWMLKDKISKGQIK